MARLVYVTYADGAFTKNLRWNGFFARWLGGASRTLLLTRADLVHSPLYAGHRDVFDAPRGAGYWAWKPWAILEAMRQSGPDDVIFYQDCGFGFRYKTFLRPTRLMAMTREQGFLAGVVCPQYGINRQWNRAACRKMMGCLGNETVEQAPTVQATLSFWTNTPRARAFVQEWLDWCLQLEAIRDATEEEIALEQPDFINHRHDQAILTNMTIMQDAPRITVAPGTLPFAKSVSMVEIDQRAKASRFFALLCRGLAWLGRKRRGE